MQLTPTLLQSFFMQLDMRFQAGYQRRKQYWSNYAELYPSNTEMNVYSWLAELPDLVEWVGEKVMLNLKARAYSIVNKDWQQTVTVDRNKIEDDLHQVYGRESELQGDAAARWPEKVVTAALLAGTSAFGFDGQAFFDTDHPVDIDNTSLGVYSNYLASTPLTLANYASTKAKMRSFKGESGLPLQVLPTLLMVPPNFEKEALEITKAQNVAQIVRNVAGTENVAVSAPTNVYQGDVTVVVNERLIDDPDPDAWYLMSTDRLKPIVFQQRKAPTQINIIDPQNPLVFNQRKWARSVEARGNGGYCLPFLAIKAKPGA